MDGPESSVTSPSLAFVSRATLHALALPRPSPAGELVPKRGPRAGESSAQVPKRASPMGGEAPMMAA
eukprot:11284425-Alexandrium_andersonii.AAC.1